MNRLRRPLVIAAFMCLLLTALWLDHRAEENTIVLDAIYNLSGAQSGLDISSAQGVQLAVDINNAEGGVLDRRVHLTLRDGQTGPAVIATNTYALLDEHRKIPVIMGMSDTAMVLAAAPVAAARPHAFITSGATSPRLPAQVPGYLFLACFGDNVQSVAGAERAFHALAAKTVAIIYDPGMSYTRLLDQYFQTRFSQLGSRVNSLHPFTKAKPLPALEILRQADLIYAATGPEDALAIVKKLRQAGFAGPIRSGDSFDAQVLWQAAPDINQVFFTTHVYLASDNPNPQVQKFTADYWQRYPTLLPHSVMTRRCWR